MDFQRSGRTRTRWFLRLIVLLALMAAVTVVNLSISYYFPNVPVLDRRTLIIDTVRRGEFVHRVRGVGQLVSQELTLRSAETKARVARIVALPGVPVQPETLLLVLTNPELELAVAEANSKVGMAEADRRTQAAILQNELLRLESAWRKLEAEHEQAEAKYLVSQELRERNESAVSRQQLRLERIDAESLLKQRDFAEQGWRKFEQSVEDRLAVYDEQILQAKTNLRRAESQFNSLRVLAGAEGVLSAVLVEVGQQFDAGELLAKVVNPRRLKAELRVSEVDARYLRVGQPAHVDTHHGVVTGTVSRIDPSVVLGSVTVDISFGDQSLPEDVRPDLSVNGFIEVSRVADVVWVGRPAAGMATSSSNLYRLVAEDRALRVPVEFGLASANAIVVRHGLAAGDQVILSDMRDYQDHPEVELD